MEPEISFYIHAVFHLSFTHCIPFVLMLVCARITDVDECSLGSECDEHASCQNTDGSHICTCIPPYSGDGRNCTGNTISL